ncbi:MULTISPECIES: hypothetical protein [unclassified Brevibacillus]|uniref:hypothetical protein n=1 Tax=unclassified Brevibacillus TaxID=2684853 RepID=UPI003561E6B8
MKKQLIVFLVIAIVAVGGFIGWQQYNKSEYTKNLKNAMVLMITETSKAEEMTQTYAHVWRAAIDGGVEIDGQTTDDFNHALNLQADSFKKQGKMNLLNNGNKEVDRAIQSVNNPPADLKKAYDIAFDLYGSYSDLVKQAKFPSGTLLEFSRKLEDLSSNIEKQRSQFNVLIPIDDLLVTKPSESASNEKSVSIGSNKNDTEASKESASTSQPITLATSSEPVSSTASNSNEETDLMKDTAKFNGTWNNQGEDGAGDYISITFKTGLNATIGLGSSTSNAAMFSETGDIEVTFNNKGETNFTFNDGYTGVNGTGTVKLENNQVTITTKLETDPMDFSVFQGTKTFTKKR